jgi:DNA-binding NarL/FixJ family response regulator
MPATLKILIVEDEFLIAMSIKAELERAGYKVCGMAAEGEKAVQLALSLHPDVVLMDIGLKGEMNGLAAAKSIQASEDIPVIFVSGYLDDANLTQAKQYHPLTCLSKPLAMGQLKAVLEKSL